MRLLEVKLFVTLCIFEVQRSQYQNVVSRDNKKRDPARPCWTFKTRIRESIIKSDLLVSKQSIPQAEEIKVDYGQVSVVGLDDSFKV